MLLFLNPTAAAGNAGGKWRRIETAVRHRLGALTVVEAGAADPVAEARRWLRQGHTEFVAAGGDGTVNHLLGALLAAAEPGRWGELKLGAIGLGSSNDFHKPFPVREFIEGIAVRLDFASTIWQDMGEITFARDGTAVERRFWLINASVGITADANDLFNHPGVLLQGLKRRSVDLAVACAALQTIGTWENRALTFSVGGAPARPVKVTNLGIVKNPHFAGNLHYDLPCAPDSGVFHVHLAEDMSRWEAIEILWRLAHGEFTSRPHTRSWSARELTVTAAAPFAVEFDGEVITTSNAAFSLRPRAIQVCS